MFKWLWCLFAIGLVTAELGNEGQIHDDGEDGGWDGEHDGDFGGRHHHHHGRHRHSHGKERVQICRAQHRACPFLVAYEPRVPYEKAALLCKELWRGMPMIDQQDFIPVIELQQECLGMGSLAWVAGNVTEAGCPALLTTQQQGTYTYVNCEAYLPVICERMCLKGGRRYDC